MRQLTGIESNHISGGCAECVVIASAVIVTAAFLAALSEPYYYTTYSYGYGYSYDYSYPGSYEVVYVW